MSISKRVTYISPNIVNAAADPLRKALSAYWSTTDNSPKRSSKPQLTYLAKNKNIPTSNKIIDYALSEEKEVDATRLPSKTLSMRVYGNPAQFSNQGEWNDYIKNTYNAGAFLDHTFTVDKPFTKREARDLGGSTRIKTCDVNLEYNYYQEIFERMQASLNTVKALPNIYAFYSLKEDEDGGLTSRNAIFKKHVSLGGALSTNQSNQFTDKASENPKAANSAEYLKSFSRVVLNRPPRNLANVLSAYSNIMLSPASVSLLKYNNKRFMFPMFGEITFATDKTTQFTQILQDSELSAVFMKDLYGASLGATAWGSVEQGFTVQTLIPVEAKADNGVTTIKNITRVGSESARVWDIEHWYDYFKNHRPAQMKTGIFLGQENREIEMAGTTSHSFYKKMIETIFIGKVRTLVKSQQRKFIDILDGDSCYSEEVVYKIEKYVGDPTGAPVQTFWIANTNEVDVYNFIDTQVRYGEQYSYKASVFNLVLGSRYSYSKLAVTQRVTEDCVEFMSGGEPVSPRVEGHVVVNSISKERQAISVPRDQRFMAEFDVHVLPHLFMVEVPFFVHTSRLIDDPPLAPEIDILPYRTDSRFLKFFMQASSGEKQMMPITITEEDKAMVAEIRKAKNLTKDEPITFAADDPAIAFQIYRMDKPPRRYEDFKLFIRKTVSTDISKETPQKASAIAYVDQLRSNQKYYYMFRSIDVHNMVGEPSPVYEIEMVNDKGAFYPVVRLYDMNTTPDVIQAKTGRRFIQVIPNIQQALINEDKSGFDDYNSAKDITGNLTYGFNQESVWNKKFKIRLTSTKTGKKIDVNLRFKTKRVKTDLEESS